MNGIRTKSSSRPHSLDAGFSFVELMVVIVIIVIVATLALMQRGSANEQFQRQNVARELKVALERARFDSVKRRADGTGAAPFAFVAVTETGFTLTTFNSDANGVAAASNQAYTFPSGILLEGYNFTISGTPVNINFNRRGEASVASGTPQFMVCNGTCGSPPGTPSDTNIVLVTPTGTVNLLPGGSSIPTFTNPTVTTVDATAGVNPDVVLP